MSGSGHAPNVSMDDLLASIKSMIEGESDGQNAGTAQGAVQSNASIDDDIMDLTQIVNAPGGQPVGEAVAPLAEPPLGDMPPMGDVAAEMAGDMGAGDMGLQAAPPQPQHPGLDPSLDAMASMMPAESGGEAEAALSKLAGQIDGITGAMEELAQAGGLDMAGQMSQQPAADTAGGGNPLLADQGAADFSATDGQMGQDQMGLNPMDQSMDLARQMAEGGPPGGPGADTAQLKQAAVEQINAAVQLQSPENQIPQGQPPVSDQNIERSVENALGNQDLGNQAPGNQRQGHQMMGDPLAGQMVGADQHQIHGQPPGAMDQRMASEVAMDQALAQAQTSLNVAPQNHPPHGGADGAVAGGIAGAASADLSQQHLPVAANSRQMQMVQSAVPQPATEQLPVEMRNNLEEIVKQLLKPLLREWLERNLPDLLRESVDPKTGRIDPNKL